MKEDEHALDQDVWRALGLPGGLDPGVRLRVAISGATQSQGDDRGRRGVGVAAWGGATWMGTLLPFPFTMQPRSSSRS